MTIAENMDELRRRYIEAKQADDARNTLIDVLFQKVDDMQKTMERNAFVMVLVDGDCMNVRATWESPQFLMISIFYPGYLSEADHWPSS